jgi:hypothetical protein
VLYGTAAHSSPHMHMPRHVFASLSELGMQSLTQDKHKLGMQSLTQDKHKPTQTGGEDKYKQARGGHVCLCNMAPHHTAQHGTAQRSAAQHTTQHHNGTTSPDTTQHTTQHTTQPWKGTIIWSNTGTDLMSSTQRGFERERTSGLQRRHTHFQVIIDHGRL